MKLNSDQLDVFKEIIERNGRGIMNRAIDQVLSYGHDAGEVSSASKYHIEALHEILPVFPAITALSCEAAGGKKENIEGVAAALTLFVEAANVHDDIIDQAIRKNSRKTTFGKFGSSIALLTGDLLLANGALMLWSECRGLSEDQNKAVHDLTFKAMLETSKSAAKEIRMRRNFTVPPQEYLDVIRLRAAVLEAHCRIGAILAGGTEQAIDILANYGKRYAIVATVVDEFMDFLDFEKFKNRLKNECVPLPLLYAIRDVKNGQRTSQLVEDFDAKEETHKTLIDITMSCNSVKKMQHYISTLAEKAISSLSELEPNSAAKTLSLLMQVVKEFLCNVG
jgi:geranylgeranyl pyrophosphate synthase